MSEPKWSRSRYLSDDGRAMYVITPHGLVPPPLIELHEPMVGPVKFVYAGEIIDGGDNRG